MVPTDKKFVEILSAKRVPVLSIGAATMLLRSLIQKDPVLGRAEAGIELSGKKAAMLEATIFPRGILDNSLPSPTNFVARRTPTLNKEERGIVLAPKREVGRNP